jgi:tRNA G18 (ribose-2'-O)-methylase SpoU
LLPREKLPSSCSVTNTYLGVPDDVLAEVDECVEIPMVGWGASLNVAVAGSLVAYRLAGLS